MLEAGGAIQVPQQFIASIEPVPSVPIPAPASSPAPPSPAPSPKSLPQVHSLLLEAAEDAGLPATFVLSVAKVESDFVVDAKSPKGAVGLMQLMPVTAATLGVTREDVHANAFGGALYLRQLLIRYRGEARLALAAYNAGPALVDRFHDVPPIPETQRYVELVMREYERLEAAQQVAASTSTGSAAPVPRVADSRSSLPAHARAGN